VMSLKGLSEPACHAIAQLRANSSRTSPDLTIEEALAVFAIALGLPPQSAGALFTLGRAAGWLAHAREQQESHFIIRPRAQFVPGSRPSSAGVH
jgi:citrate synthase